MTRLLLKLHQPMAAGYLDDAAVATVRLLADAQGTVARSWWAQEKPVTISGESGQLGRFTEFDLPGGGHYEVDITQPRGPDITRQLFVGEGETRNETIKMPSSPHEHLGWQQYAGIVQSLPYQKTEAESVPLETAPGGAGALESVRVPQDPVKAASAAPTPVPRIIPADVPASAQAWALIKKEKTASGAWMKAANPLTWPLDQDDQFAAWFPEMPDGIEGEQLVDLLRRQPSAHQLSAPQRDLLARFPRWIAFEAGSQIDLASVPWAWWGEPPEDLERIRILYDRIRPSSVECTVPGRLTLTLQDRRWTGILEFLSSGRLNRAGDMVAAAWSEDDPRAAMQAKITSPLVAVAGALVLVSRAPSGEPREWDPWLDKLCHGFPGVPDGPIILGCRRVEQARDRQQLTAAYQFLLDGIDRGIPFFSATIQLLSVVLARVTDDIPEAAAASRQIAAVAAQVDPEQAFTVIRLPRGKARS